MRTPTTIPKIQYYLLALAINFVFIALSSCNPGGCLRPPEGDEAALSKVYEIDAANDTIKRWSFTYDNWDRILTDSFTSTEANPSQIFLDVATYSYSGLDTRAIRKVHTESVSSSYLSSDTTFYVFTDALYDRDSVVFNHSLPFLNATSKTKYVYQQGVVLRYTQTSIPGISHTSIQNDTIHQSFLNNNLVYQVDSSFSVANTQSPVREVVSTDVTYLNNPNPFYKINLAVQLPYINQLGIGNIYNEHATYAPRHLISQQHLGSTTISYTYTFRSDGYPLTAMVTLNANGIVRTTRLVFIYKA